ncbi:MAG: alpha-L-fucosidase [Holophagaceae bacterium]|nr:alpha-L-fucosidase [Holophagaceae bacterium]
MPKWKKCTPTPMAVIAILSVFLVAVAVPALVIFFSATKPPKPWGATPSPGQLAYHREELAAFIHFGMNTFTGREWGDGKESPAQFKLDPSKLDTKQWVDTIMGAGFKRLIFVAKHHDGFCNWYSDLTQHSVKYAMPENQVDILEKLSKSCTDAGLNMGIYLSPWDANSLHYGKNDPNTLEIDPWRYNNYYIGQLKEILDPKNKKYGNDGVFVEVWMDGARGAGYYQPYFFDRNFLKEAKDLKTTNPEALSPNYKEYPGYIDALNLTDQQTWFGVIKEFNPDMVIFSPAGSELRWPGTESGKIPPHWSKVNPKRQRALYVANGEKEAGSTVPLLQSGDSDGTAWSIAEADTSILASGWFENNQIDQSQNKPVKTLRQLGDIYFESVGRGGVLLLNFAPNVNGVLSEHQTKMAKEIGEAIRGTFATNLATGTTVTASTHRKNKQKFSPANVVDGNYDTYWTMDDDITTGEITIDFGHDKVFDVVSIQEYIPLGQRVFEYRVEVFSSGQWIQFGRPDMQTTIGYKALVRDMAVTASQVRITIEGSQAVPVINSIGVYKTACADLEIR